MIIMALAWDIWQWHLCFYTCHIMVFLVLRQRFEMQKIFDAHLHLWDLEKMPISWLKGKEKLEQNYDFLKVKEEYKEFQFLGAMYVEVNSDDLQKEALFAFEQKKAL